MVFFHLKNEEDGNPLVVRVVKRRLLHGQPGTGSGEFRRYVEGAVHPAVTLQDLLADAPSGLTKDSIFYSILQMLAWQSCLTRSHCIGSPNIWLKVTRTEEATSSVTDLQYKIS